jgi:hypothetical protein
MSIFTYHLIEALTGHARPAEGAREVLVSDVMSHVHRRVPQSARADWGADQTPDYRVSGNFPVALLLGGQGLDKGRPAPDPLEPLPAAAPATSYRAEVRGSGAVAQGPGAVAAGARGVAIGGSVGGSIVTGDGNTVMSSSGADGALPARCPHCGAALRADRVEWVSPSAARCPYCGGGVDRE